ncbi:hypothetical protein [Nereida sp. MMG025]|uniref:hypothetical protein n=1 Tax=Nereida sp. MMG025 TaxID=2909981 RepID=UPI001F423A12|nr:hypothetical protein [Nereida sp. MMG025]MCF6445821.1 hypothetical protein [Nereida sp. MMG025]
MRYTVSLVAVLALAACSSARDRCLNQAALPVAQIDALIVQTEANIARGFGLEKELQPRSILVTCVRDDRLSFCQDRQVTVKRVPVTLDIDAERRKLSQLKSKRAEVVEAARKAQASCPAA